MASFLEKAEKALKGAFAEAEKDHRKGEIQIVSKIAYHLLDPEHGLIVRRTKAEADAELRRRKAVREAA